MTLSKRIRCGLVVGLIATLSASPVFAAIRLAVVRTNAVTFTAPIFMPLNDAGSTTLFFVGSGRHLINYSAECARSGGNTAWLSIQVFVDGVALAPTSGIDDAFCSGDNTPAVDGWVTAHYSVPTGVLGLGLHSVRVQATLIGAGTGRLDDASLSVTQ
jgi:hypothetical protein